MINRLIITVLFLSMCLIPSIVIANDAPTLTQIEALGSAAVGRSFQVTYEALYAASDVADVNTSDTIQFVVQSVASLGTLLKNGVAVSTGVTTLGPNESLIWNSGASGVVPGDISAFTVRAYDGTATSGTDITVVIQVTDPIADKLLKLVSPDATTGSKLGNVIAVDGDWAIVGAPDNGSYGTDAGVAYLYKWDGRIWSEYQRISATDVATGDHFGQSVAISSTRAVIGAPGTNNLAGSAYVFELTDGRWIQNHTLTSPSSSPNDQYGFGVAMSGDFIAVLSPQNSDIGYIYEYSGGQWSQVDTLVQASGAGGSSITSSSTLSMSGTRLAVGAPLNATAGTDAGAVFIFTRNSSNGLWDDAPIYGITAGDLYGRSVSLDSDRLLVGAPGANSAYVYNWSGSTWDSATTLTGVSGDFGSSVSVSGDALIVGAPSYSTNAGAAYVYVLDEGTWPTVPDQTYDSASASNDLFGRAVAIVDNNILIGAPGAASSTGVLYRDTLSTSTSSVTYPAESIVFPPVADADKRFGYSVDVSGDWMVMGATWSWEATPAVEGLVYVSKWDPTANNGAGEWSTPIALALPTEVENTDYYGSSVAIDGNHIVVGAFAYDDDSLSRTDSGAVFTYELSGGTWGAPTFLKLPSGIGQDNNAKFGSSVDIDGNRMVVGAPGNHSIYVYQWTGSAWSNREDLYQWQSQIGSSVAIAGNRIVTGSPQFDTSDGSGGTLHWAGQVYLFDWDGTNWVAQILLPANPIADARFGWDVAVNDQWVVVSAMADNSNQGAVYTFTWDDVNSTWVEYKLTRNGSFYFGESIALTGNRIAAGHSDLVYGSVGHAGEIVYYDWDGSSWTESAQLSSNPLINESLGRSLAASENWIVSGAIRRNSDDGCVYTFGQNSSGSGPISALTGVAALSHSDVGVSFGGSSSIESGDSVTVTAFPTEGYTFFDWQGETDSLTGLTSATLSFTSDSVSRALVPVFKSKPYVSFAGEFASYATGAGIGEEGTTVTVTAGLPPVGYVFSEWKGQLNGMALNTVAITDFSQLSLQFTSDQNRVLKPVYVVDNSTTLTVTANDHIYNVTEPTQITGTVSNDQAVVTVTIDSGSSITPTINGTEWTISSAQIGTLTQGIHTIEVSASYGGNNANDSAQLVIDTAAPVIDDSNLFPVISSASIVTLSIPVSDNLTDVIDVTAVVDSQYSYNAIPNGSSWSLILNNLTTGTYSVSVTATDEAGNESSPVTGSIIVTLSEPVGVVPTVTLDPACLVAAGDPTPTLYGTVSDLHTFVRVTIENTDVNAGFKNKNVEIYADVYDAGNGVFKWILNGGDFNVPLIEGAYEVTVYVESKTEVGGANATGLMTIQYSDDLIAPNVTVEPVATVDKTPLLTGTVNDPEATVKVDIRSGSATGTILVKDLVASVWGNTWTVSSDSTWYLDGDNVSEQFRVIASTLSSGTYYIVARAFDKAGNEGSDSNTLVLLPAVSVDSVSTEETTPTISGTFNAADTISSVSINYNDGASNYTTAAILDQNNGTWTASITNVLSEGAYDIKATITDTHSNQSNDLTSNELMIEAPSGGASVLTANGWNMDSGTGDVKLDGQVVANIRSTAIWGNVYDLGDADAASPEKDWNWAGSPFANEKHDSYYCRKMGYMIHQIKYDSFSQGNGSPPYGSGEFVPTELTDSDLDYSLEHSYQHEDITKYVKFRYDHKIAGPDLIMTLTIDNTASPHYFQLLRWLELELMMDSSAAVSRKMYDFYPSPDAYSPVTAISDSSKGFGVNFIEHRMRSAKIVVTDGSGNNKLVTCLFRNSPVPPGGTATYKVVLRIAKSPDDWKYLLAPYKEWFNRYFGPVKYNVDFRINALTSCSSWPKYGGFDPGNPLNFDYAMDKTGWGELLYQKLKHLGSVNDNCGPVIFWGVTGHYPEGANYRPEFDVFPPAIENDWQTLIDYFANDLGAYEAELGPKRFGFFARPNHIAYHRTNKQDAVVNFNPLDPNQVAMSNKRFKRLRDYGATAFYLDTYGNDIPITPGASEAYVRYLRDLRNILGPDSHVIPEGGFDAFHVYAPFWIKNSSIGLVDTKGTPNDVSDDETVYYRFPLGNIQGEPLSYARWLIPGSSEICRIDSKYGGETFTPGHDYFGLGTVPTDSDHLHEIWSKGAIPIMNEYRINGDGDDESKFSMTIQHQYVNGPNDSGQIGTHKFRTDCRVPGQQ